MRFQIVARSSVDNLTDRRREVQCVCTITMVQSPRDKLMQFQEMMISYKCQSLQV